VNGKGAMRVRRAAARGKLSVTDYRALKRVVLAASTRARHALLTIFATKGASLRLLRCNQQRIVDGVPVRCRLDRGHPGLHLACDIAWGQGEKLAPKAEPTRSRLTRRGKAAHHARWCVERHLVAGVVG
jgi:hypothetical protein